MTVLGLDIGSNSVGSAWLDLGRSEINAGVSIFPAGVEESDDKRGDPKNAKRRMTRRTRITLRRRAERKRELRLRLMAAGLLPVVPEDFKRLLEDTDPWELRRKGLDQPLAPHEFGRVLLHLAQRRGALGLNIANIDDGEETPDEAEDGKVKAAIRAVRLKMLECKARTFGEFIAMERARQVFDIESPDRRKEEHRKGPRQWRKPVRNKAASYEHCADRAMIRDEFAQLWKAQVQLGGETAKRLMPDLRLALDDESGDDLWRHKGLLFGQRRQSWDLGTLGRCVLEPTERCAPHADMYASRYLVVETVNNLRIIERGRDARPLTPEEREKIKAYLSGPLGMEKGRKVKGKAQPDRPKRTVSITDLRRKMAEWYGKELWTHTKKTSPCRFKNEDSDEERQINTDWFSREIIHGAVGVAAWEAMPQRTREGLNRAILKFNPEEEKDADRLRAGVMDWAGLNDTQAEALIAAWRTRPKPDARRLNMSRRAVRNLLTVMDRPEPWPDPKNPAGTRWLTQIEARKCIASDGDFLDVSTGKPLDDTTRRRYATGAKGATARDRYYMGKHTLMKDGKPVIGPDGQPLAEPPPAPLISNPVVRKAIHEVRRHLVEYMTTFGRKPERVCIELAREARMGKMDADRMLFKNRLRNRIRNEIISEFHLDAQTATQQRAAVDRVVLCVQQGGVCPLCGQAGLTARMAANGEECDVAHIVPRASGGHNGHSNLVLAHRKCNREMGRRTPRQFWSDGPGFEKGMQWVEGIYGDIQRIKFKDVKSTSGEELWKCYFTTRDDDAKIAQFKKDVKDIQEMSARQEAATKYAARQVMAYLADALYDGKGLPERSAGTDDRRIFATDGLWTSRLRREWGLFFDPHDKRAKGLAVDEAHARKEKDRGDHRHHAIDAIITALTTQQVQYAWEAREKQAELSGVNTADEEQMENYRRLHPLDPPAPFKDRESFRNAVRRAVYGEEQSTRPVCHRPVKRKLIGALHEETLFGPVLDAKGELTGNYTAKKSVLALTPNHLRMPDGWDEVEAGLHEAGATRAQERELKRRLAVMEDPPPGKSGIVRDRALRGQLRRCLRAAGLDPDSFTANEIKKAHEQGQLRHDSGVPIRSVVLLRTMSDPVIINRKRPDHATGRMVRDDDPASKRAYVGGNNHHIEIRAATNKRGQEVWTGEIVSAFDAAQRNLARLRAFREARIPKPNEFRKLPPPERRKLTPVIRAIEQAHPLVDRRDDDAKGGRFVMSLCEGEMLSMKHKETGEVGYFVVAKLDKRASGSGSIVVVPHWDARAAGERKDSEGKKVPDSRREQFAVTPSDLQSLAPPGHDHAVKVRVSPLGVVTTLERD